MLFKFRNKQVLFNTLKKVHLTRDAITDVVVALATATVVVVVTVVEVIVL